MPRKPDQEYFLDALRKFSGWAPNRQLREELGWDEQKYWRVHQSTFDEGRIEKGRGRGGSVLLVSESVKGASATDAAVEDIADKICQSDETIIAVVENSVRELALYAGIKRQLQKKWAILRQLDECHCETVALQGRRETGGSWSRPDLCVIGTRTYEHYPQRSFEIHTFEVKGSNDVTIKGVLEALAHREAATRSYVLYYTDGQDFESYPENIRIAELANRYGVGVIAAFDIDDIDSWDEVVPAQRASSDPEAINTFIGRSLSDEARKKIRRWFQW